MGVAPSAVAPSPGERRCLSPGPLSARTLRALDPMGWLSLRLIAPESMTLESMTLRRTAGATGTGTVFSFRSGAPRFQPGFGQVGAGRCRGRAGRSRAEAPAGAGRERSGAVLRERQRKGAVGAAGQGRQKAAGPETMFRHGPGFGLSRRAAM
ncbi:Hypothetical protein HVPorG_04634 [Roseomonas mucosa]|nr:Hypothetical protein HVPorG_04634 [Roseomonas mucosa]